MINRMLTDNGLYRKLEGAPIHRHRKFSIVVFVNYTQILQ